MKTLQAAEPQGEASESCSGGEPPTWVSREALGQEGRLWSLENFFLQERQLHKTHWTVSKGEGAGSAQWGPSLFLGPHLGIHRRSSKEGESTCAKHATKASHASSAAGTPGHPKVRSPVRVGCSKTSEDSALLISTGGPPAQKTVTGPRCMKGFI